MNHKLTGSIAAAAVLGLGVAACSSSPSSPGTSSSQGKPLVIETTALSPMVDNFNPFVSTSTAYTVHATDLYNLPLYVFDTLKPSQPPIPELATGYSWSSGGRTVTVPEHVWSSVSNPATYTDAQPVSDGPYVLHQFSPQGFTMTVNPDYYARSTLRVP